MMHALIVRRKGDNQEVFISPSVTNLKAHADTLDGSPLQWQSFFGEWGAHSNHDEEKSYEIVLAQAVP